MSYTEDRLQEIADAIREKTGETGTINAEDFVDRILEIETGVDTSDATATAADILERKTAYAKGVKIRGTMEEVALTIPVIEFDSATGLVKATVTQFKNGYINASTKSSNKQLETQISSVITPGTTTKTAVPIGRYTTGTVYVAGDPNLIPPNIKAGVKIFGVNGSAQEIDTFDATAKASDILQGKTAYVNGKKIIGLIPKNSANDIFTTASEGTIEVIIASGYYEAETQTTITDQNLVPENIKSGVTIFGVTGTFVGGDHSGGQNAN